ncbi:ComF family protein [Bacillota bacterium]
MIRKIAVMVLELIYPSNIYCICCGRPIDCRFPYSVCPACMRTIRWTNSPDFDVCGDFSLTEREFDRGFACARYGFTERRLVHDFKYRGKSYLAGNLGLLMFERIRAEGIRPDFVVSVPMHKNKERRRGYNQADLLAGTVSEKMGVPLLKGLLIRTKDTYPMSMLNAKMRKENTKGVFRTAEWVKGIIKDKTILLVDDVFTTGSTAEACSLELKKAGAGSVYVLTFAASANAVRGSKSVG